MREGIEEIKKEIEGIKIEMKMKEEKGKRGDDEEN